MAGFIAKRRDPLLLICILLILFLILSAQAQGEGSSSLLATTAARVFSPVVRLASGVVLKGRSVWRGYVNLVQTGKENRFLRNSINELTLERNILEERLDRFRRGEELYTFLQGMDPMEEETIEDILPAAVISNHHWDPRGHILVINRGLTAGLLPQMPVITAAGVVGKTLTCTTWTSRVLLATDPSSGISARVLPSRAWGIVSGHDKHLLDGTTSLIMNDVSNLEKVDSGNQVITSGLDGIFPAGFPLGMVRAAADGSDLSKRIYLVPAVEMSKLEEVLVIIKKERFPEAFEPEPGPTGEEPQSP